jgi:guanylate kinase
MVLLIFAATSGTGKSTLGRRLRAQAPNLKLSISHTTRAPREGEVDGVHYHFVSREAFVTLREAGGFVEWAEYAGNLYGTAKSTIEAARLAGHDLLFDVEIQGAEALKATYPAEAVSVFILPPSWAEVERRLRDRGTETEARIERRLRRGVEELAVAHTFDRVIINDDLDAAVADVAAIYRSAQLATQHGLAHLTRIREAAAQRFEG